MQSEPQTVLEDRFGRVVDYLRLSVTDRCDFRCVYCMAEDMRFLPRQQVLTLEEMAFLGRLSLSGCAVSASPAVSRWCAGMY